MTGINEPEDNEMAVIVKYVVVRNNVELEQTFTDKKEAEAYDKLLDAAEEIGALIRQGEFSADVDATIINNISLYLAKNAPAVLQILKPVKPVTPASESTAKSASENKSQEGKDQAKDSRSKAKTKAA